MLKAHVKLHDDCNARMRLSATSCMLPQSCYDLQPVRQNSKRNQDALSQLRIRSRGPLESTASDEFLFRLSWERTKRPRMAPF